MAMAQLHLYLVLVEVGDSGDQLANLLLLLLLLLLSNFAKPKMLTSTDTAPCA